MRIGDQTLGQMLNYVYQRDKTALDHMLNLYKNANNFTAICEQLYETAKADNNNEIMTFLSNRNNINEVESVSNINKVEQYAKEFSNTNSVEKKSIYLLDLFEHHFLLENRTLLNLICEKLTLLLGNTAAVLCLAAQHNKPHLLDFYMHHFDSLDKLDTKDEMGKAPLHYACANASHEALAFLLSLGCFVNVRDHEGNTPLHYACEQGDKFSIDKLVHGQANINAVNSHGNSPLDKARAFLKSCDYRSSIEKQKAAEIVESFLAKGAGAKEYMFFNKDKYFEQLKKNNKDAGIALLCQYAAEGDVIAMRDLLHAGEYINRYSDDGTTPLAAAVIHEKEEAVAYLLRKGADTDILYETEKHILHIAAAYKDAKILSLLIPYSETSLNALTTNNETPLDIAKNKNNTAAVELLIKHGACTYAELEAKANLSLRR